MTLDAGRGDAEGRIDEQAAFVTDDYFSVLGIRLAPGRGWGDSPLNTSSPAPVAVIGYPLWSVTDFPPVPLPPVAAIASAGVLVVALAAIWVPARRAASVEPAETLHGE